MSVYSDIIVVGGGSIGLMFAKQFEQCALSITVIEKSPLSILADPPFDGREIALTHHSQDFLNKSNIWQLIPETDIYPLAEAKVINGNSDYQLYFKQPTKALGGRPTDRLGFLVSNRDLRKACYEAVKEVANINLLNEVSVTDVTVNSKSVTTSLSDGTKLNGQLLICADGRFSTTRQKVGIPADTHQFGRTVVCFRVKHDLSNQHTACEYFHYGHTLAILPLEEHLSSIVITINSHLVNSILTLSDEQLAQKVYEATKGKLGQLSIVGEKNSYPLEGIHARRFYTERCALIGDAAVGMHPVTAHGFNLGVESVGHLSKLILQASKAGQDIGSETLLERYNLKHQAKTRIMYHGTNFVVKLFTSEDPPAKLIRTGLLRVSNQLTPIKQLISRQLTG